MFKAVVIILALTGAMVVNSVNVQSATVLSVKPTAGDRSVKLDKSEDWSSPQTVEENTVDPDLSSDISHWTSSDSDYTDPSSPSSSPDYGVKSYYGESDVDNLSHTMNNVEMNLDPIMYYHPGPPQIPHRHYSYRRRRPRPSPRNLFRLLQSTLSSKANQKFKRFQSALKALGVTPATMSVSTTPITTPTPNSQPNSEISIGTTSPPKPASNPAVELIAQLAPTLTKLVDSVGNAVGGEGSLLALKRDSVLARLKYKKALFIGLPESLIMAKLNLPNTLINGKKALLGVVSSLAAPKPMPSSMMSPDSAAVVPTLDPGSDTDPTPKNVLIENPPTIETPTPDSLTALNSVNQERLADKVSITYQDLEPMSSQIRFRSSPMPLFNLQPQRRWRPPPQYYSNSNHFHHPFKQRRRRFMYTFD